MLTLVAVCDGCGAHVGLSRHHRPGMAVYFTCPVCGERREAYRYRAFLRRPYLPQPRLRCVAPAAA